MKSLIRIRMGAKDGHYGGGLVDGAKILELFGDVATELCIRTDGDEGLFRAYESVEFLKPVLVSQVVTQRDVHKENARALLAELERLGIRDRITAILGGPRIDHRLALQLGYDAGFGPGTRPSDVAAFIVGAVLRRMGKEMH